MLPLYQLGKTPIIKPKPVDVGVKNKLDKSSIFNINDDMRILERVSQNSVRTSRREIHTPMAYFEKYDRP